MVVLFHLTVKLQPFGYDGAGVAFLQAGVDIFFVISGFIMVQVSRDRPRSGGRFLADRIVRIVPLYWLLTLAMFVLLPAAGQTAGALARSLLFIPGGAAPLYKPLIGGGWTLNLEMYFYVLFALSLAFARSETNRFALVTAALLAVVAAANLLPGPLWRFYGNEIVLEFVAGMALARVGEKIGAIGVRTAWALGVVGAAIIAAAPFALHGSRLLAYGLPAAAIVAAALALERAGRRVSAPAPLLLGAISYALYLSHGLVIAAVQRLVGVPDPHAAPQLVIVSYAFALVAALGAAWLLHAAFEVPVTRTLKQTNRAGKASALPAPLAARP